MAHEPTAYPLTWPHGWRRLPEHRRVDGKFATGQRTEHGTRPRDITISEACDRLYKELERMAVSADDVIISTNVQPTLSGRPRSGERIPADPGAAVYWTDRHTSQGQQSRCMAIDRYTRVEQNIAALAATVEAMRAIERHGGAVVLDRAFMGFTALPAPIVAGMKRHWREVLGYGPDAVVTESMVRERCRKLAREAHPDKGGTDAAMAEVNVARDEALQEISR